MASKTLITAEQYLAMHFEREPEFVRGELVERGLPKNPHSRTQQRLAVLLDRAGYCRPELRMKLAENLFRIPDIAVFGSEPPDIPDQPPFLVVEVNSPDDRIGEVIEKLEEYRVWGVDHIWFVEPDLKKLFVYSNGLIEASQLHVPEFNLSITPEQLFA
jgi:Uma2 family endonuclease